jgi:hypothetical protein
MRAFRFIFGIGLGLFVILAVIGAGGFAFLQQLSRTPPKPIFAEAKKDSVALDIRPAPDDSYPALVMYQGELILREGPDSTAKALDKLKFEDTVVVTGTSTDGQWQQVRVEFKDIEGWVRAGNLKRAQ